MDEYENITEFFKNVLTKKDLEEKFLACNGIQEIYDFTLSHCKNKFSKEYFERLIKVIELISKNANDIKPENTKKNLDEVELKNVSGGWKLPFSDSVKDFLTFKENKVPGSPELTKMLQKEEPTHRSIAKIASSGATALNLNVQLVSSLRDIYRKYEDQNTPENKLIQELKEEIEELEYKKKELMNQATS